VNEQMQQNAKHSRPNVLIPCGLRVLRVTSSCIAASLVGICLRTDHHVRSHQLHKAIYRGVMADLFRFVRDYQPTPLTLRQIVNVCLCMLCLVRPPANALYLSGQ